MMQSVMACTLSVGIVDGILDSLCINLFFFFVTHVQIIIIMAINVLNSH